MKVALIVALVAVVLFAADRALLWAERRGRIFYRRRTPDSKGAVLNPVFDVLNPSHHHVVEEQEYQRTAGAEDATDQDVDPITGMPLP